MYEIVIEVTRGNPLSPGKCDYTASLGPNPCILYARGTTKAEAIGNLILLAEGRDGIPIKVKPFGV